MKKITLFVLFALFASTFSFSQENEIEKENDEIKTYASIGAALGDGYGFYVFWEGYKPFGEERNSSIFLKASNLYGFGVTNGIDEVKGKGYTFSIGGRSYLSKNTGRGFFTSNEIKYSTLKFEDKKYLGTYSYFSFFAPEIGYKLMFGKNKSFGIEISGGVDWAIEVKGKGDVDNKIFDNWKPKAYLGLGYAF